MYVAGDEAAVAAEYIRWQQLLANKTGS